MVRRLLPLFLLVLIAGCGGGGGDGSDNEGSGDTQPVLGAGGDEEQGEDTSLLGFPIFATKNTTRVAGADPVANAAGVARAVYPARTDESSPRAMVIVEQDDWRAAISAAQLMARPLQAPMLFSDGGELPAASAEALEELAPSGAEEAGNAQVIRIGDAAKPENRRVTDIEGTSSTSLAEAIDRFQIAAAGAPTDAVLVRARRQPGVRDAGRRLGGPLRPAGAVDAQGLDPARDAQGDPGAQEAADLRARPGGRDR